MTLQEFSEMLLTVTEKVYHFEAWKEEDEYIVWQELQGSSIHGDDVRCETVKRIQLDLYTKEEFPKILDTLLAVLEENDVAFEDPIPDYDKDTKQTRYIIRCEVI